MKIVESIVEGREFIRLRPGRDARGPVAYARKMMHHHGMTTGLTQNDAQKQPWLLWLVVIAPMVFYACWQAAASDGVYHDDDLMHYLMARWSWHDPVFLLHDWGRPGFTVPYALVAWVGDFEQGFQASRFFTVAIAAASAFFACALAHELRVRFAWLAGVALLAMPLYFRLSFATLTETICGLYLIAGTWLLAKGWLKSAAILLALAPITRHESIVFLVPVALYFLSRRSWSALLLLAWAEALWNLLSIKWYWMLPVQRYFQAKPIENYGHGGVLHYFLMWGHVSTPVLLACSLAGAAIVVRPITRWLLVGVDAEKISGSACSTPLGEVEELREFDWRGVWTRMTSISACDAGVLLVVIGAMGMIALQTVLYYRNTFASGGYARFLVPAGPWMAVLCAITIDRLLAAAIPFGKPRRCDRSASVRWAAGVTAIAVACVWLASRAELPQQSEWMIRSLYQGWAGLYVERYTWALVVSAAVTALWPRRLTAIVTLGLACWWVGNVWWHTNERLFMTPGQRLIGHAIDAAQVRADALKVKLEIRGQSPWVDYYMQRTGSTSEPSAADWWTQPPRAGDGARFLLIDNDYTPEAKRAAIDATPHEVVFSKTLKEVFPDAYQYWYQVDVLLRTSDESRPLGERE